MEDFKVKAHPEENFLEIILGGYIMNSDIELVFYIAKQEVKHLKSRFEVRIDVRNFRTKDGKSELSSPKTRESLRNLGAGKINSIQHNDVTMNKPADSMNGRNNVGLYAYENGWFL
jgi:hypothetical protein